MGFKTDTNEDGEPNLLQDSPFEGLVLETLSMITRLFYEGDKLRSKYGCVVSKELVECERTVNTNDGLSNAVEILAASFTHFRLFDGGATSTKAKLACKTKWVIQDRQKFGDLIQEIRDFVDGLQDITKSLSAIARQEHVTGSHIQQITDPDTLSLISEACQRDHPNFSDVASTRFDVLSLVTDRHRDIAYWATALGTARTEVNSGVTDSLDMVMANVNSEVADLEELTVTELKSLMYHLRTQIRHPPEAVSNEPNSELGPFVELSLTPVVDPSTPPMDLHQYFEDHSLFGQPLRSLVYPPPSALLSQPVQSTP